MIDKEIYVKLLEAEPNGLFPDKVNAVMETLEKWQNDNAEFWRYHDSNGGLNRDFGHIDRHLGKPEDLDVRMKAWDLDNPRMDSCWIFSDRNKVRRYILSALFTRVGARTVSAVMIPSHDRKLEYKIGCTNVIGKGKVAGCGDKVYDLKTMDVTLKRIWKKDSVPFCVLSAFPTFGDEQLFEIRKDMCELHPVMGSRKYLSYWDRVKEGFDRY